MIVFCTKLLDTSVPNIKAKLMFKAWYNMGSPPLKCQCYPSSTDKCSCDDEYLYIDNNDDEDVQLRQKDGKQNAQDASGDCKDCKSF